MQIPVELKAAYKAYQKECRNSHATIDLTQRVALVELQRAADEMFLAEYNLYRAACHSDNITPVLADFLAGEIPDGVSSILEYQENEAAHDRKKKLLAATA